MNSAPTEFRQKNGKICPSCRAILSANASHCACGFRYFKKAKAAPMETFCGTTMNIGGVMFVLACLTAVALRFL